MAQYGIKNAKSFNKRKDDDTLKLLLMLFLITIVSAITTIGVVKENQKKESK